MKLKVIIMMMGIWRIVESIIDKYNVAWIVESASRNTIFDVSRQKVIEEYINKGNCIITFIDMFKKGIFILFMTYKFSKGNR